MPLAFVNIVTVLLNAHYVQTLKYCDCAAKCLTMLQPCLDCNGRQVTPTVDVALDTLRTLTGTQTQWTSVARDR